MLYGAWTDMPTSLAPLLATLAVQVGQDSHGGPIRVAGHRLGRLLALPTLVYPFGAVAEILPAPKHPSNPSRQPNIAAPRFELSRHALATTSRTSVPSSVTPSSCGAAAWIICSAPRAAASDSNTTMDKPALP